MIPSIDALRRLIERVIADRAEQGHEVDGLVEELEALATYDDLVGFAGRLDSLPLRNDWRYAEPDDLDEIRAECDPERELEGMSVDDAPARISAAFLARVCGCMLGKPFEIDVGLDEIRAALSANDEWPLRDYPGEVALRALPTLQGQWRELARERITHVAVDDDINYTVLAMLALEQHGTEFTHDDLRRLWMLNLPVLATFGPERTKLVESGLRSLAAQGLAIGGPALALNPGAELCGALIRADAYGYACLGRPELAVELAHRDASFTHSRTGIYGAMFVAAAIAVAPFADDGLDIVRTALRYVPKNSRFAESVRSSLLDVEAVDDWLDGYARVHARLGSHGFCRIHQEIGTVVNTLRFARDVGEGICLQVMQGNDTDSFGATVGSILGAHFGSIESRWYEPFNDVLQTALAMFHESSLERVAARMGELPRLRVNA